MRVLNTQPAMMGVPGDDTSTKLLGGQASAFPGFEKYTHSGRLGSPQASTRASIPAGPQKNFTVWLMTETLVTGWSLSSSKMG